jgi:opacity protein-like surface antigen
MHRVVCTLSIAFLCSAAAASAQSVAQPRTWTATPFLEVGVGTGAPTSSGGIGAAIGYDMTSNLGFEGEVSRLFDVAGNDENVDWSVTGFNANAIYHFDVVRVTPYATAGLGFERSSVHVDVPDPVALVPPSSTEVTFNFGGGVKYRIANRFLARADLRRFQANDTAPDYWRLYGGLTFTIK